MYKVDLEKGEESKIKLPTFVESQRKRRNCRKTSTFSSLITPKTFCDYNKLWEILKEMGISHHLTCLLHNPYAGQEATVRTGHGTIDWFKTGKGVPQGCILSPCLFNFYAEYIMQNAQLDESQAGIKIARRNIINSDMEMVPL